MFLLLPSVQAVIRHYQNHGNVQPSHHSVRRQALCPRDESVLVHNVLINPRTKAEDFEKMLPEAGNKVSLSAVNVTFWF